MQEPAFASMESFTPSQFARFVAERASRGDLHKYELLNGRIIMNPPSGWPHGEETANVVFLLKKFSNARRAGRVFESSQGFQLPSGDIIGPDVSFVSHRRWKTFDPPEHGKFLRGVPDLVVEVHSPSTRRVDLGDKRAIYEANGVPEYWLVDSPAQRITVMALEGGRYEIAAVAEKTGTVASRVLKGLRVRVADVFTQRAE